MQFLGSWISCWSGSRVPGLLHCLPLKWSCISGKFSLLFLNLVGVMFLSTANLEPVTHRVEKWICWCLPELWEISWVGCMLDQRKSSIILFTREACLPNYERYQWCLVWSGGIHSVWNTFHGRCFLHSSCFIYYLLISHEITRSFPVFDRAGGLR